MNLQLQQAERGKPLVHADSTVSLPRWLLSPICLSDLQLPQAKCAFPTGCGDRDRLIFEPQHRTQLLQYLTSWEASPCRGKELGLAVEWGHGGDQQKPDAVSAARQGTDMGGGGLTPYIPQGFVQEASDKCRAGEVACDPPSLRADPVPWDVGVWQLSRV